MSVSSRSVDTYTAPPVPINDPACRLTPAKRRPLTRELAWRAAEWLGALASWLWAYSRTDRPYPETSA